ncbi:hypothetical protein [Marinomonas sp. TW1]|uniref:hypothetical protein n=1 Tax=Marinomonas sp. TW1 TaxID=1561203 RepID=UPI0007AF9C52|nr:hypothetical protein [Marinomonas sp. TW1]KZN12509.1 hypothetical protein OA79_16280 [Marinomonas sp. TW1]
MRSDEKAYADFSTFINPESITYIVSSLDWGGEAFRSHDVDELLVRTDVPVDKSCFKHSMLVSVLAETQALKHSHNEPTFRLLIDGKATFNGVEYQAGDWLLVPRDYPYDMVTHVGFKALVEFGLQYGSPDVSEVIPL